MNPSVEAAIFFRSAPLAAELYAALHEALTLRFPDLCEKVQKSQISLCDPRPFCWCSLRSARSDAPLIVTFGLIQRIQDPRIWQAVEPYPNRWTHHIQLHRPEEIDDQLLTWLDMSHLFRCRN